jgi:prepilin-type N-terminal cleavage/methylation domain-containing protein
VSPKRRPRPIASRASRGFTLLELVIAFAILSIVIVSAVEVQATSVTRAAKARDLRELRILADTVFRRIVYEDWKWQDGMRGTADEWYADFAGFSESAKHRWKIYRLELHKRKGMVAGTDPTGKTDALFSGESDTTTTTNPSSTSSTSGSSSTPGSSTTGGAEDPNVGEPAYEIELDVFSDESEEPIFKLRSVVPVPDKEREEEATK